ncbi:endothelin-converting enzyme homolog [Ornithodoros turicata]|uniref:endothelin-converting enzyme homolog n=1 Tax=Ornithodoros turicata TaxID=34597 RepID=UPI003139B9B1
MIAIAFALALAAIALAVMLKKERKPEGDTVCDTEDCQYMRWLIDVSVDTSKDPCANFYLFTCSGAFKELSALYDRLKSSNLAIIQHNTTSNILESLKKVSIPTTGQTAYQKSAAYFRHCAEYHNATALSSIKAFLTQHGMDATKTMNFDILGLTLKFIFVFRIPLIFGMGLSLSPLPASGFVRTKPGIVMLLRGSFVDSMHEYKQESKEQREKRVSTVLSAIFPGEVSSALVNSIMQAEDNTASEYGHHFDFKRTGMDEAKATFDFVFPLSKLGLENNDTALASRWHETLRDMTGSRLPRDKEVATTKEHVSFFYGLFGKAAVISEGDTRLYFAWRTAFYLYTTALFDPEGSYEKACLKNVLQTFPNAASSEVLFSVVNASRINFVEEMADVITEEVKESLKTSQWIDDITRQKALQKISSVEKLIGYVPGFNTPANIDAFFRDLADLSGPYTMDYINVLKFETKLYWDAVLADSQYLDRKLRLPPVYAASAVNEITKITIPAGVMLPPVFAYGAPPEVNYGSLGRVITNVVMETFDVMGIYGDAYTVDSQWFTNRSIQEYNKRIHCYNESVEHAPKARQYNQHSAQEYLAGVLGSNTIVRAYQKASKNSTASLGNLKGFTKDQIFYISFCLAWCGRGEPDAPHPPFDERCNVPLMNSEHFSETFSCHKDSPMNPSKKCSFW